MSEEETQTSDQAQGDEEPYLLDFYGTECVHCHEMDPLVEQLEKELNVKVKKVEVWHNAENNAYLKKLDNGRCGGVPFYYNKKTDGFICGSVPYEKLKAWALGEQ